MEVIKNTQYTDGEYLQKNPGWHIERSEWKANHIIRILSRNNIRPKSIVDVGCGVGEILKFIKKNFNEANVKGYDISAEAIQVSKSKEIQGLTFHNEDYLELETLIKPDLLMAIDVFEHIEDYFSFLRKCKNAATYKIYHIPLELSVISILRMTPLLRTRKKVGHLHYFSKETALAVLKDTGHKIIDFHYTKRSYEGKGRNNIKAQLGSLPKRILFPISKKWAVRILGGYSMMVLCK